MIKFKTVPLHIGGATTETREVKTLQHFNDIMAVSIQYKEAYLNDVALMKDSMPIMAVRNHVPELLAYLNGEADDFLFRSDTRT